MDSRILNVNPLIAVFDGVFGQEVADAAIAAGQDRLEQPSYGTKDGRVVGEKHTNQAALVDQWSDPVLTQLMTDISAIVRIPPEHGESSDLFHRGGQRLFTTLCYLNDVEEEGQTAFPNLMVAVRPKLGRVLVMQNTLPGQNITHPDSAHVGFGPGAGEKWVLSVWWREHHFHIPRSYPAAEGDFLVY
ncbi:MAG: hypothetical protein GKR98_05050 [Boseongicola sp.]|nr:MAG: hypothetical protein GKR98_05050 [Boseongicola sp.]